MVHLINKDKIDPDSTFMPEKHEDKFIVINRDKLRKLASNSTLGAGVVAQLAYALLDFNTLYNDQLGEDLTKKKYVVCNEDEPYIETVWDAILKGEKEKGIVK